MTARPEKRSNAPSKIRARFRGCLLGLAVGDAVGTALEFHPPGSFQPIDDLVGGGPFQLNPGEWTDDTSMALCLAESLVECRAFEPRDQMQRYLRWFRQGYLSSNGRCFDIGNTVRQALLRFESTGDPYSGSRDHYSAGNGSLMRLAPVAMFYALQPEEAIERSGESSRTTPGAQEAVDACRYMGGLLVGALSGAPKDRLLSDCFCPVEGLWDRQPLAPAIEMVAKGSYKDRQPPEIKGSGYVVRSLEAALWAFFHAQNYREGCLLAANLGDDADTTAAIYGQLAGAFHGEDGIPEEWRACLALRQQIEAYAERLYDLSVEFRGES
jgi:ADP-ribosyl-[dinitrogen reductase] hydrolase